MANSETSRRKQRTDIDARLIAVERSIAHYGQSIAGLTVLTNSLALHIEQILQQMAELKSANERREGEL